MSDASTTASSFGAFFLLLFHYCGYVTVDLWIIISMCDVYAVCIV